MSFVFIIKAIIGTTIIVALHFAWDRIDAALIKKAREQNERVGKS